MPHPRSPIGENGIDIVGTEHSEYRPGQEAIDPVQLDFYAQALRAGAAVPAPEYVVDLLDGRETYILADGHHRYVASKRTGIPLDPVRSTNPLAEQYVDRGFRDWSGTRYERYLPDDTIHGP